MPYVRSLTDVLSGYLDWHLSRLKLMARFTELIVGSKRRVQVFYCSINSAKRSGDSPSLRQSRTAIV